MTTSAAPVPSGDRSRVKEITFRAASSMWRSHTSSGGIEDLRFRPNLLSEVGAQEAGCVKVHRAPDQLRQFFLNGAERSQRVPGAGCGGVHRTGRGALGRCRSPSSPWVLAHEPSLAWGAPRRGTPSDVPGRVRTLWT